MVVNTEPQRNIRPGPYSVDLPAGFVPLPTGELNQENLEECSAGLADLLLIPNDSHCRTVTGAFSALAMTAEEFGVDRSAVGLFFSKRTEVSVMLFLTMTGFSVEASDTDLVIAGLKEILRGQTAETPREILLPSGPVMLSVAETPTWLSDGSTETPLLQRSVTCWAPSPGANSVGVVTISTNNWPEWDQVCEMAIDIFATLTWET